MSAVANQDDPGREPSQSELEHYLYHEARLIDEQRWEEWGALFTDDGEYWVPATPGQPDPLNHVSLMYETKLLRAVRLKRMSHPNAFSVQANPRSVHLISNVMLDSFDSDTGTCVVNSRFIMLETQRDKQNTYGGACAHTLVPIDGEYRIAMKRVDLVNCNAPLESILVVF